MGRIVQSRAGRRMFVGVLALAGLALVACEPLKPPPESPPPELPQICIPNQGGDPRALAEPAPTEPACTPICLPGQEPQPDTKAQIEPGPVPAEPACVPICQPSTGGGGNPEAFAQVRDRCIRIPVPCVPGVRHLGLRELLPAGAGKPAASGRARAGRAPVRAAVRLDPTGVAGRMREVAREREVAVGRAHGRGEPARARVR
jgi:hypothetical protein